MAAFPAPCAGGVLSADIAVPEHEREAAFYASVLTTGSTPLWRADLSNNRGMPVIGLGARSPEFADLPLQWMPHIQVADVGAGVERAVSRGGRALMHQKDEGGRSQWAVLLDPNGAAFGLIPVVPPEAMPPGEGGSPAGHVGRISWLDLTVPDASVTRDFYREVVGWSVQEVDMEDAGESYTDYVMCASNGDAVAGICHARGVNRNLPPVWLICLPVGDLAQSLARVRENGGEVVDARAGSDGTPSYAAIRDPVGVCLALVPG
ncbi:MAG: VOC family protein [Phycisphaerales bacterium JB038]